MNLLWISALLLATCFKAVVSEYDPSVCNIITESYGLVPPPIPTNFEFRAEEVDSFLKIAKHEEVYFDYTNSRAKYMYILKGIEHHFLFDYQTQQVIQYDILHPGVDIKSDPLSHTCTASELEDSIYRYLFGDLEDNTGKITKMFSSNRVLRFGGQYKYAYNGSSIMPNRGLMIDKFIGCFYDDDMEATFNATYLFSTKKNLGVGTAGGDFEGNVTGIDNGLLSIPVKSEMLGSMDGESFNYSTSFYWFKADPEFKREIFQIPPYLYCTNYRGRKDMPKFPTAFSTRVQLTKLTRDIFGKLSTSETTSFENVYYYKEKNLARKDFTPSNQDTEIYSQFSNYSPVKTIYDFNQGLIYVTNIPTGRCFIRPIEHGDFFETSENILYISMGDPEEIFQMQTDKMEYRGKDFTRDIECDVWAGIYEDKKYNATYTKETYISSNGWHEEVDEMVEYGVPIKHTLLQKELEGELKEGVTSYSFLKFKSKPPLLRNFDVSNCIEPQNHKDYALLLTLSPQTIKLIFDYKSQFLETAQYYISDVTQVLTPLRVQRLQFRQVSISDTRPLILFTLVDKIKLKTKIPFGQKGANLNDAAANLQKFIDTNQFAIKFYAPGSKEMTLVPALKGSLYVRTSSGDLTYFAPVSEIAPSIGPDTHPPETIVAEIMHDNPLDFDDEESKGMSSGSLALLGFAMLFIGIGIGVAVMYLYLRYQKESKVEDRIHLSPQTSVELSQNSIETEKQDETK